MGSAASPSGPPRAAQLGALQRALHDANGELSIAVLQLELLLEAGAGEASSGPSRYDDTEALAEALEACRRAAASLRQAWGMLQSG
jgi:hypothetical protein